MTTTEQTGIFSINHQRRGKRSTLPVADLKAEINRILALPLERISTEERKALAILLENVLHATGNYQGYNDLHWIERGCREWEETGLEETIGPHNFDLKRPYITGTADGSETYRRVYY